MDFSNASDEKVFDHWNKEKKRLDKDGVKTRIVHEGEIWWCSLGKNTGDEENGKNALFERPVLIIKRFNKRVARVLPMSSKIRDGSYYQEITHGSKKSIVLLPQLRIISVKRLRRTMDKLNPNQLRTTREKIRKLI